MADRKSARIFSELFTKLSKTKESIPIRKLASELWGMQEKCDFSPEQLGCNEALEVLGLARRVNGEWEYGPQPTETIAQVRGLTMSFDWRNVVVAMLPNVVFMGRKSNEP